MEIFYILLILLLATRLFGEIAVRLNQPALVGELISGILIGTAVQQYSGTFPVLAGIAENEVFVALTDLGVFFLMLYAGIEMRPRQIMESSKSSVFVASFGLILPLGLGFALAWWFIPASEVKIPQCLFVGTGLAITAVPVAVRVLLDLGQLETRAGQMIVSAAVYDDVFSLMLLAVLTALIKTGGLPDASGLSWLVISIVSFFAIVTVMGLYVLPWIGKKAKRLFSDELEFSLLLLVALGFAVLAEFLQLHFILGAFAAGLFFSRRTIDEPTFDDVKNKVSGITTGFLAPLFFASIGFHLDLSAFTAVPLFVILLVAVAFGSKLLGAAIPAYTLGLPGRAAIAVGVAMSARGAVELIIADIALRAGLFERPTPVPAIVANLFSSIVIMAIATTLIVPIALRQLSPMEPSEKEDEAHDSTSAAD